MRSLAAAVLLILAGPALAQPTPAQPTPERQQQLATMLAQDCGSCHGMTRKGGLGSPLLPEILSAYSHEAVVDTILEGRPGTPMPPWKTMLSRDDAEWMARTLMGESK